MCMFASNMRGANYGETMRRYEQLTQAELGTDHDAGVEGAFQEAGVPTRSAWLVKHFSTRSGVRSCWIFTGVFPVTAETW